MRTRWKLALRSEWAPILAFCFGFLWLILIYFYGIGITSDGSRYLEAGLRQHYTFRPSIGALWPPFYPFLINLSLFVTTFPAEAAALVSGLLIVVFLTTLSLTLREFDADPKLNVLFVVSTLVLAGRYSFLFASSDTPFMVFLLLNFYFLIKHNRTHHLRYYILAAACVSAAALTRFVGYSLIIVFFAYTLHFVLRNRNNKKVSARSYLLWNSVTYIPSALWVCYNFFKFSSFHGGSRRISTTSALDALERIKEVVYQDLGLPFIVLCFFLLTGIVFVRNRVDRSSFGVPVLFAVCFLVVYFVMLIYATTQVEIINGIPRFVAVLYFYFFILVFIAFVALRSQPRVARIVSVCVYVSMVFTLVQNTATLSEPLRAMMNRKEEPAYHIVNGFNVSSTREGINEYFQAVFARQDTIHVAVISGLSTERVNIFGRPPTVTAVALPPRIIRGIAFVFRERILRNKNTSNFTFKDTFAETKDPKSHVVSFMLDDRKKVLVYHRSRFVIGRTLHDRHVQISKEVRRILKEEGMQSLLLIVWNDEGFLVSRRIPYFLTSEDLEIQAQENIDPYTIYEISLADCCEGAIGVDGGQEPRIDG